MKTVIPTALGVRNPSAARESVLFFRDPVTGFGASRRVRASRVAVKGCLSCRAQGEDEVTDVYFSPLSWTFFNASSGEMLPA